MLICVFIYLSICVYTYVHTCTRVCMYAWRHAHEHANFTRLCFVRVHAYKKQKGSHSTSRVPAVCMYL